MKIEKISENQIRCTLNKEDLVDRELRISELAYGTEKAKALFRDMMQQASYEFGFEAEDIPLMIEAIPVSSECLVLVITKVDDPDELDTRFSKFSPDEENEYKKEDMEEDSFADEIINCFGQINEISEDAKTDSSDEENKFIPLPEALSAKNPAQKKDKKAESKPEHSDLTKVYSFRSLEEVSHLAGIISSAYKGENTLYKDPVSSVYYLVIHKSEHSPEDFNKVCNIISEYGKPERTTYASFSHYEEHYEKITQKRALQVLNQITLQ